MVRVLLRWEAGAGIVVVVRVEMVELSGVERSGRGEVK